LGGVASASLALLPSLYLLYSISLWDLLHWWLACIRQSILARACPSSHVPSTSPSASPPSSLVWLVVALWLLGRSLHRH
jgi:hypothetical protein